MIHSAWKNIAVFLDNTPASKKLGEYAAQLAAKHGAHLIGIYGLTRAESEVPQASFTRGDAIKAELEHQAEVDGERVLAAGKHLRALTEAFDINGEFRVLWSDRAKEEVFLNSLHCDLIVVGHPIAHGLPTGWSSKRVLFSGGVPVLIVPNDWNGAPPGKRVVVAWNASREARRAIGDAMPAITTAEVVTVLVVDSEKSDIAYGEEPGADVALYLTRHGAKVDVRHLSSGGRSVAETIMDEAGRTQADLIVLGAYSHSRSTEIIFGGVTRSFLAEASIPLLMSR